MQVPCTTGALLDIPAALAVNVDLYPADCRGYCPSSVSTHPPSWEPLGLVYITPQSATARVDLYTAVNCGGGSLREFICRGLPRKAARLDQTRTKGSDAECVLVRSWFESWWGCLDGSCLRRCCGCRAS